MNSPAVAGSDSKDVEVYLDKYIPSGEQLPRRGYIAKLLQAWSARGDFNPCNSDLLTLGFASAPDQRLCSSLVCESSVLLSSLPEKCKSLPIVIDTVGTNVLSVSRLG